MSIETKATDALDINQVVQALELNRKAVETNNIELQKKTDAFLDVQEKKSQELTLKIQESLNKEKEHKERMDDLEAKLCRYGKGGVTGDSFEYASEKKAFNDFARTGVADTKTLNTESAVQGGFLVPISMDNEISKKIIEISDVRKVARVKNMGKLLRLPIRDTLVTSGWQGELQTGVTSQSSYAQKELVAKTLMVTVPISRQELEDAAFDMASQIASDVAVEFARQQGAAFVNGVGSPTVPQGFMTDASVESFNSGSATDITMDSILNLPGQLKIGYNPIWAFNRRTKAKIRQLKDSVGQYLWQAGNIAAGVPNQLDGYNYAEWIDMPDIGAGTYPVIFGDFYRGYTIGDRQGMFVIRDDYTKKNQNVVEFQFSLRTDGIIVLSEAFKKIKISA
jgi:HK97 family phage major capsid protein